MAHPIFTKRTPKPFISLARNLSMGAIIAFSCQPSTAAFPEAPLSPLSGEILVKLQNDYTYSTEATDSGRQSDLFVTVEPSLSLSLAPGLSLETVFILEPVRAAESGRSRAFKDHGVYVDTLRLIYEQEKYSIYGGKFTPNFGVSWHRTAPLYGDHFAADYTISEQIGIGGSYTFNAGRHGIHTLSASTFFADSTELSRSAITTRGRLRTADGGVGNTESFSSFALALDGNFDTETEPRLTYHVALIQQGNTDQEPEDQRGVALALEHPFKIGPELTLTPLLEYVHFNNYMGIDSDRQEFMTASLAAEIQNWTLETAYGTRRTKQALNGTMSDTFTQISLSHPLHSGVNMDVGWLTADEDTVRSETLGVLFHFLYSF